MFVCVCVSVKACELDSEGEEDDYEDDRNQEEHKLICGRPFPPTVNSTDEWAL